MSKVGHTKVLVTGVQHFIPILQAVTVSPQQKALDN